MTMTSNTDTRTELLEIDRLSFDQELQVRVRINDDVVAQYAECMTDDEGFTNFKPIEVFYDGAKFWLADGHHRRAAAIKAGRSQVWANIHHGTQDDAAWKAITANGKQGFGLNAEDRKRAIEIALKRWPRKSNQVIGEAIGCSHMTIKRHREALSVLTNVKPETTTGKDGKQYKTKKQRKTTSQAASPSSSESKAEKTNSKGESTTHESGTTTGLPFQPGLHCRPGEKPGATGEPYVPTSTLENMAHNRPDILVSQLIALFPREYTKQTVLLIFDALRANDGTKASQSLAREVWHEYGDR